jgi:hypothetical protein
MERSFALAANNHHFKRARWRRLWRQQIQDYLIASIQNVRILLAHQNPKRSAAAAITLPPFAAHWQPPFASYFLFFPDAHLPYLNPANQSVSGSNSNPFGQHAL